jgi:hypothetical protein
LPKDKSLKNAHFYAPGIIRWEETRIFLDDLGYDLVFPLSVVPLKRMREKFPEWETDRRWRPLMTVPFLFSDDESSKNILLELREKGKFCEPLVSSEGSIKKAQELCKKFSAFITNVQALHVLMPRYDLWKKPFENWTDDDK